MERADVDRWLADYIEAWKTYDPERIGALFSVATAVFPSTASAR
jgi:hypothetical protein